MHLHIHRPVDRDRVAGRRISIDGGVAAAAAAASSDGRRGHRYYIHTRMAEPQQQQVLRRRGWQEGGADVAAPIGTAAREKEEKKERGRCVVEAVVRHGRWAGPLCALLGVAWILLFPVLTITTGGWSAGGLVVWRS